MPNCPGAKLSVCLLGAKLSLFTILLPNCPVPNCPTITQVPRCPSSCWPKFAVAQSVVAKINAAHGGQVWNREPRWDWDYYRICFMLSKILQVDAWNQKYLPRFWAQKGPLLAIGATTRPVKRPSDHLLENQRYPELPQDMGMLWSHWVGSVWDQKRRVI